MRVLMTTDAVGGVWSYALQLVQQLVQRDVSVTLAVMGPRPSRRQIADAAALGDVALHMADFRLEWQEDPWADLDAAGDWLLDLSDEAGADLIHLNGYVHAALPWRVPVVVVAHSCVCSWWMAVRGEPAPRGWARYREAVTAGVMAADLVVAPTAAMLAEIVRHYGLPRASTVIANGRRLPAEGPRPLKEPLIAAVGRLWDEGKNLAALASVAPQLPWPVQIAGDDRGPDGERWTGGGAHLLGRLESHEVATLLRRASLFVHPARYEPFGLAPLEAALAGCPLVLGDIGSLREVWDGAAAFVPPDDPAAMVATIRRLTSSPPELARLAGAAAARAARLRPETMALRYLTAYAMLIDRHRTADHPAPAHVG